MKQKDIYLGTVFVWRVLGHDWLPTSKDIIDMILVSSEKRYYNKVMLRENTYNNHSTYLASLGSVGPELEQAIKFVCS